jgi:hypothetical protein
VDNPILRRACRLSLEEGIDLAAVWHSISRDARDRQFAESCRAITRHGFGSQLADLQAETRTSVAFARAGEHWDLGDVRMPTDVLLDAISAVTAAALVLHFRAVLSAVQISLLYLPWAAVMEAGGDF